MFTGDRAGDWLFASLHRAGLANQPTSSGPDDGLSLPGVFVTAAVRCVPPANRPTPAEARNCAPYLLAELELLTRLQVVVALGAFAYRNVLHILTMRHAPQRAPPFAHGAEFETAGLKIIAAYHPSQQNTFTGRLIQEQFDAIWARAQAARRRPSGEDC
jgi:uracil-DNA glycosylase family 4